MHLQKLKNQLPKNLKEEQVQTDYLALFDEYEQATSCNNTFPLLDYYVQQGFVFLTPDQVMKVTGKTWGQIRYAIYNYDLDCYIPCGEYRITVQALKDYIDGVQDRYERPYHDAMLQRELSGIHALAFEGRITEAYGSLLSHGYPVSAMDDLMQKTRQSCYNDMPAGETEAEDFYDIPSLPIPDKAYLYELADMFQVSSRALCNEMGISDYTAQVDWPTVYDYLVIEQFLNRNIPVQVSRSQKIIKDDGQLMLF